MNEINLSNFREALAAIELTARNALNLISGKEQEKVKDTPKEEPEEEKGASMESLRSFQSLVSNGNISPDKEEKFYSLVKKAGLDYAIEFYSDSKAKSPTIEEEVTSNRDESGLMRQTKDLLDIARRMGYDSEKAKEIVDGGGE